ncbi:hypothetical protein MKX01_037125 [Papaver californicum]|nr:hypothetical protein MKX01_037125 [Papaver californicum]
MAMVLSYASTAPHHHLPHLGSLGLSSRRICSLKPLNSLLTVRVQTPIRALSTTIVEIEPENASEKVENIEKNILACPVCYNQLKQRDGSVSTAESTTSSSFQCATCKKATLNLSQFQQKYSELLWFHFSMRGDGGKILYGVPGPDKEFEMAKKFLKPILGGNIIDASCGSGLFSRRFAKSGLFSLVVALDFSENMLQQCSDFVKQEKSFPTENLTLVRADISRLPFVSSSVDAVHAGAALHCWPSPSAAVAEISRVLKPGGVLVATTFILDGFFPAIPFLRILRQNIGQVSVSSNIFLSERELEDLCKACGLVDFTCVRNGSFIILSATKPR